MADYDFDLVLSAPTTPQQDEAVFETFEGRATPLVIAGRGVLSVHLSGTSLDTAMRDALERASRAGLEVERIEVLPEDLTAEAA